MNGSAIDREVMRLYEVGGRTDMETRLLNWWKDPELEVALSKNELFCLRFEYPRLVDYYSSAMKVSKGYRWMRSSFSIKSD